MRNEGYAPEPLLPEWGEGGDEENGLDDEAWIAALEASRREQFAELKEL